MDKTSITSTPASATTPSLLEEATPRARSTVPQSSLGWFFWKGLSALASLRLTVILFTLAMILVFTGTLAQREYGIWTVVERYFRNYGIVWIPFKHLLFSERIPGSFPFPGGFFIGCFLMTNLLAAHLVRFKLSLRRSGVVLTHLGLIVLMVSEVITAHSAVEGNMIIVEGGSANFVQDSRNPELAILTPGEEGKDQVVAIPGTMIRKPGKVSHELLPFDVEVLRFMPNSGKPIEAPAGADNPATAGDGRHELADPRPEVTGTDPDQKIDLPSAYVKLIDKEKGTDLGTYLLSLHYFSEDRPQVVTMGTKTYEVFLRFRREYKPYTLHLLKFNHELYPGTDTPKDYSSIVRLTDPTTNENREVRIWMNNPLRYRGETFYQSSFLPGDAGTILQVVRNPGWLMPYIACGMVAVGLLAHFGITLVHFLKRRVPA